MQEGPRADPALPEEAALIDESPEPVFVSMYSVEELTGAVELRELRESVIRDDIPQSVRRVALDRYAELLESGAVTEATQGLVDSILAFVQPPMTGKDQRILVSGPGEMTVSGTAKQHHWIEEHLVSRGGEVGQVDFEMRLYEVPAASLKELVGERSGTILKPGMAADFMAGLAVRKDVDLLMLPRVLVNDGAAASIASMEQTAYVKDYELTVLPDLEQEVADPIIDVMQTGTMIDLRAIPIADNGLAVLVEFQHLTVESPIEARSIPIGAGGHEVTVQVPVVRKANANARFDLAPGAAVVLATVDPATTDTDQPRGLILLLQAERVTAVDADEDGR